MTISHTKPLSSPLLQHAIKHFPTNASILDLACGSGRNGLYLTELGFNVTFLDRDSDALAHITQCITNAQTINGDLESQTPYSLAKQAYDVVIVFRYLHRPLMNDICDALKPGGILVYETFTERQAAIGRPKNPNFLLKDNELVDTFSGFEVLHNQQGFDPQMQAYIAQYIGRKSRSG